MKQIELFSKETDSSNQNTRSDSEVSLVGEEKEGNCGYGSCEPRFLKCCNNAKGFLAVYCCLVVVQGKIKQHTRFLKYELSLF